MRLDGVGGRSGFPPERGGVTVSGANFGMKDVPGPLGYCIHCLRDGDWVPAAVLVDGSSMCAMCGIGRAGGPGDVIKDHARQEERDPLGLLHRILSDSAKRRPDSRITVFK